MSSSVMDGEPAEEMERSDGEMERSDGEMERSDVVIRSFLAFLLLWAIGNIQSMSTGER